MDRQPARYGLLLALLILTLGGLPELASAQQEVRPPPTTDTTGEPAAPEASTESPGQSHTAPAENSHVKPDLQPAAGEPIAGSGDGLPSCLANLDRISQALLTISDKTREAKETLEACLSDKQILEQQNDRLLQRLEAAQADLEAKTRIAAKVPTLRDQLDAQRTANADLQKTVADLRDRLAQAGIKEVAGFEFFKGDRFDSYLTETDLRNADTTGAVATERCEQALEWLQAQTGENAPLRKALWTRSENGWAICTISQSAQTAVVQPRPGEEAHFVIFR